MSEVSNRCHSNEGEFEKICRKEGEEMTIKEIIQDCILETMDIVNFYNIEKINKKEAIEKINKLTQRTIKKVEKIKCST